jgi:undecaprenyl-diphosphatase
LNAVTALHKNKKMLVMCIAFLVSFLLFSFFRQSFTSTDIAVNFWMVSIHNDAAILLAKALSAAFDTVSLLVASLVIAGVLFIKKRKTQSLFILAGAGGNALFVAIIKNLAQVIRPSNALLDSSGYSYPSGHCTGVIIFMGLIAYLAWQNWGRSQFVKVLSLTSFSLVVAFVSFDRVYLNVHWLSDVVGGCLFGAFWLSFCILIYENLKLTSRFKSETV